MSKLPLHITSLIINFNREEAPISPNFPHRPVSTPMTNNSTTNPDLPPNPPTVEPDEIFEINKANGNILSTPLEPPNDPPIEPIAPLTNAT